MSVVGVRILAGRDIELTRLRAVLLQKERELRELHHRIANSLQLASSFLVFQRKQFEDPELRAALDTAVARLDAVGKLHRYIYAHSADSRIDLKPFLEELCPQIGRSTGLLCTASVESMTVSGEQAQQLAIVINELAINAAKHGYRGRGEGVLTVDCRQDGAQLRLSVADAGKGLPDHFSPDGRTGLGMTIINAIVRQLNATLTMGNAHGAYFVLTAPLIAPAPAQAVILGFGDPVGAASDFP